MKFTGKTYFILFLIAAWAFTIYRVYIDYDHIDFADDFINSILFWISIIVSAIAIRWDYLDYQKSRKLKSYTAAVFVVLFAISFWLTKYLLRKQDDTPTILYAIKTKLSLFDHFSIAFRENNTYKISHSHGFGGREITRGKFSKKDSLIFLDRSYPSDEIISKAFVIRSIPQSDSMLKKQHKSGLHRLLLGKPPKVDSTPLKFLLQINDQGNIIDSAWSFQIKHKLFN